MCPSQAAKVSYADKIRKLLEDEGLTQAALAALLGVDQSLISNYLSGAKKPGAAPCLILAGLSRSREDRMYWLSNCGLGESQRGAIAKALADERVELKNLPRQDGLLIAQFLDFWHHPADEVEQALQAPLERILRKHTPAPAKTRKGQEKT